MEPDFSGYVSRANRKCTDGRTISSGAFKHQDGNQVPLVYQHNHSDVSQVLGHVILHDREDGTWGDAFLAGTPNSDVAGSLVKTKSLNRFSVWAKNLNESNFMVHSGDIQEVSLVLAGANPGAYVENVLMHDDMDDHDDLIYVSEDTLQLMHADGGEDDSDDEDGRDKTIGDVLATLNDEQRDAVNAFTAGVVNEAVTEALTDADDGEDGDEDADIQHSNLQKETSMTRNLFDGTAGDNSTTRKELKHTDVSSILAAAKGPGGDGGPNATASFRSLLRSTQGQELMHAADYGIENIEILFPEAQALMNTPRFVDRRQEWVKTFMSGAGKTPFSRVKTTHADITADEARAKGYLKGNKKFEEVFPIFKRTTGPGWIYKKQKLDRQDIIDIKDFDVVAWMKIEMRGKLDEEIARAALVGDGRNVLDPDKVQEPTGNSGDGLRSVISDDDLYTLTYTLGMADPAAPTKDELNEFIDAVTINREDYMGSGNITAFMTYKRAAQLLTLRDSFGKRIYKNLSELAGDLDVSRIERVPTGILPPDVLMIGLDLRDYNFGTDRGGEVTLFDDFDIDFNQYKYLLETYLSGALVEVYSAMVWKVVASGSNTEVVPVKPVLASNVVTIPTKAGVVYKRTDTGVTLVAASTVTLDATTLPIVEIEATPASGYYFPSNHDDVDTWVFAYEA